jgi:transposase
MLRETKINSWSGQKLYIGLDVHKKNWKVTILGPSYEHKTFSQDPDPEILANYLRKNFPGAEYHSVYEAGFSGYWASKQLKQLGINNIIVNPSDVPTMHKERDYKSDVVDSRKLARSLKAGELHGIYEPSEYCLAARQVMRGRDQTVKELAREKNRVKSFFAFVGQVIPSQFNKADSRHWSKRFIKWLEGLEFKDAANKIALDNKIRIAQSLRKELLEINRQIRDLSRESYFQEDVKLLVSIPGIGLITAMVMLTELSPMSRYKTLDQLNRYVGLVPSIKGTGDKEIVGRMTPRRQRRIHEKLIESSWILIRLDPAMMLKYEQLIKRMEGNKAIIRIARKLLNRIRRVLITRQPYVKNVIE